MSQGFVKKEQLKCKSNLIRPQSRELIRSLDLVQILTVRIWFLSSSRRVIIINSNKPFVSRRKYFHLFPSSKLSKLVCIAHIKVTSLKGTILLYKFMFKRYLSYCIIRGIFSRFLVLILALVM